MRGLALEGGGAKGAYHLGALKALYEAGYAFDGVVERLTAPLSFRTAAA